MGNCIGVGRKKKRNKEGSIQDLYRLPANARIQKWLEDSEKYTSEHDSQSHYSVDDIQPLTLRSSHTAGTLNGQDKDSSSNESENKQSVEAVLNLAASRLSAAAEHSHSIPNSLRVDDRVSHYFTASESVSECLEQTASRSDREPIHRDASFQTDQADSSVLRVLYEESDEQYNDTEGDGEAYLTTEEADDEEENAVKGKEDEDDANEEQDTLEWEKIDQTEASGSRTDLEMQSTQGRTSTLENGSPLMQTARECTLFELGAVVDEPLVEPMVTPETHFPVMPFRDVTPPRVQGFEGDVDVSAAETVAEEETERLQEEQIKKMPYDHRPLRPMPTPIRNHFLSPTKIERIVDSKGRVRSKNSKVRELLDNSRFVKVTETKE